MAISKSDLSTLVKAAKAWRDRCFNRRAALKTVNKDESQQQDLDQQIRTIDQAIRNLEEEQHEVPTETVPNHSGSRRMPRC